MQKSSNIRKHALVINIKVQPYSSRAGIVGPYGDGLKVKLTSSPVEGKANKELIDVLAKKFKITKNNVEIISGRTSKHKIVKLHGVESIEDKIRSD
ncbi:MAG: YggU family protein [Thermodesulfovibrionia bacterium]|nr:YggU family protein [Thermodesulfovibrionia bacterium]MCK5511690.1 YggU family protein [Thermodesulfovibrionia bacterium]